MDLQKYQITNAFFLFYAFFFTPRRPTGRPKRNPGTGAGGERQRGARGSEPVPAECRMINGLVMADSSRSARTCDVSLGSGGEERLPTGTPLKAKGNGGANSPVHGPVAPGCAQTPEALSSQAQPAAGAGAPPRRARRRAQRAPCKGRKPPLGLRAEKGTLG